MFSVTAFAINGRTTYQARIVKPNGYPLESASVNFRFSVLDQSGSCILYVEDFSNINMTDTAGVISFPLGTGIRAFPTSGTSQTFQNTFDNSIVSFACQTVGIYNPNPTDSRKVVMQFNDGSGGWQTLPAMTMNAVPYAMFATKAVNSTSLNGKADTAFVEVSTLAGLGCAADQAIKFNGGSFSCISVGVSATPVTSSSVIAALGYTPATGTSFTSLNSNINSVSSSVYAVETALTSLTNSVAASFSAISGSGISTFNGSSSATQSLNTSVAGTAPAFVTAAGVHTLNIPYASVGTTTAGLISNSDYSLFSTVISKITSSAASIAQVLGYTPADQAQVTSLNSTVGSVSSAANAAQSTADSVSSTVNTLTTTVAGKVTSSAASIAQVLGYVPAASGGVSSQWTTSGTAVGYMTGSVGVGTASPRTAFDVAPATGQSIIRATSTNSTSALQLYRNTAGSFSGPVLWSNGASLNFGYDTTENSGPTLMTLETNGNLGIGTSTPNAKLSISGTSSGRYMNFATTGVYAGDPVQVRYSIVSTEGTLAGDAVTDGGLLFKNESSMAGDKTEGTFIFDGRVGVGASATAQLSIAGGNNNTPAIKLASGALTTSPSSGSIEYDGYNFYVTDGTNTRRAIAMSSAAGSYDNVNSISSTGNLVLNPTGSVVVSNTTVSTNSNTGALIVKGGLGVTGSLNAAGIVSSSSLIKATGFRANQGAPDNVDTSTNGYAFGLDGDTGMFSPGPNISSNGILAFYNNNAETMRIQPGAVGIGTSNPTYRLDIAHSVSATQFHISGSGGDDGLYMLGLPSGGWLTGNSAYNGSNWVAKASTAQIVSVGGGSSNIGFFNDAGLTPGATYTPTSRMLITPLGNIGVNVNTPQRKMHLSATSSDGFLLDNGTGDSPNLLFHDSTQVVSGVVWNLDSANGAFRIFTEPITAINPLTATAGIERLVINSIGQVGIGTTAPTDSLHVVGAITAANASATAKVTITPDFSGSGFLQSYSAPGVFRPLAVEGQRITMNGHGSGTTIVGGAVGINRSPSSYMLDVEGSFRTGNADGLGGYLSYDGIADLRLGYPPRGSAISNRALVADVTNALTINYLNDFTGGVKIGTNALLTTSGSYVLGNFGIGTTTPAHLLEVSGSVRFPTLDISGSNAQNADRPYIRGTYDHFVLAPARNRTGAADQNSMYLSYPGDLVAGDTVGTRIQESLFISQTGNTGGGNVGVGIVNPTSKFEVRGGDTFMEGRAYVYSNSGWGSIVPGISLAVGDNDTGLNWVSDGVLQIYSNNQPRMHFTVGGAVGVNRTDPTYNLDVNGTFRVTGQAYTDTGAATFTVLSDARYKDIHGQYERGLEDLLKIGTVRYNYKKQNPTGADSTHEYVGVLAQNVQENIPEAVEKQVKDGKEFLTVNPSPIIFDMLNGFRDMYSKIVQLMSNDARMEREIASLKSENEELKNKAKEFDELKAYICKKDPEAPNCK